MGLIPDAILLDLDDTILDDTGCVGPCWADACAEAARRLPAIDAALLQQAIQDFAVPWWNDPTNSQLGRLDLRAATRKVVREAFRRLGFDNTATADETANFYRDLREERARMHDGALETIEWLRGRGVKLGMMTNGAGPSQRAKIERFDLARHFDHILIEGEFGVGKPDRRVFETLLAALNVHPSRTWAAGDNLHADVFGAMDVGITGIWIDNTGGGLPDGTARQPDRIVRALRELHDGASSRSS